MTDQKVKIESTAEAWESGELGLDENYAKEVEINNDSIDSALDLKMISIRLQQSLLDDLKMIATDNSIGYQPLIKQILARFVDGELKKVARTQLSKKLAEKKKANEPTAHRTIA